MPNPQWPEFEFGKLVDFCVLKALSSLDGGVDGGVHVGPWCF